jgi:predicted PurR-regulated permease PerM
MEAMGGVSAAVVAAIVIATLYFGREVFVPIALAILLSFVLAHSFGCCSVGTFHARYLSSASFSSHLQASSRSGA